ncbi:MAG: hypothetical protein IK115_00905 [Lachnospiraceae bacterium]|nr:hypothetical protein [Lachnospiraceae bacterium]
MTENNVKIPLIIAVVLQGIALLVALTCVLTQESIIPALANGPLIQRKIVPINFYIIVTELILQLGFLLTVFFYGGEARRGIAAVFAILKCVLSLSVLGLTMLTNVILARQGSEMLTAHSLVSSSISTSTLAFTVVSSALFFIALGRYGISETPQMKQINLQ